MVKDLAGLINPSLPLAGNIFKPNHGAHNMK
jgi:hypothetical protein